MSTFGATLAPTPATPTTITTTGPVVTFNGNKVPLKLNDIVAGTTWIPTAKKPLAEKTVVVMEKGTEFDISDSTKGLLWLAVILLTIATIVTLVLWLRSNSKVKALETQISNTLVRGAVAGAPVWRGQ